MKPMTNQEIFDLSTRGIIAQGGPAFVLKDGTAFCMYRTAEGHKCAAGQLLPDDEYTIAMENRTPSANSTFRPLLTTDGGLLSRLQAAHDAAAAAEYGDATNRRNMTVTQQRPFWDEWRDRLTKIVAEFSLDGAAINEIPVDMPA